MTKPIDRYPSQRLDQVTEQPIGVAKFQEPVFKMGVFQDTHIEVTVTLYPLSVQTKDDKTLVGVRFGEMPVVRFVNKDLLYDVELFEVE